MCLLFCSRLVSLQKLDNANSKSYIVILSYKCTLLCVHFFQHVHKLLGRVYYIFIMHVLSYDNISVCTF